MKAVASAGLLMAGVALAAEPPVKPRVLAPPAPLQPDVARLVTIPSGRIALRHVRVIDGTGADPQEDRTVLLDGAQIAAVLPGDAPLPAATRALDYTGMTVLPGLVGMHDHLYYIERPGAMPGTGSGQPAVLVPAMLWSAVRLYLANGVTTLRTTGSVEPYADLNLKAAIDAGRIPGPHLDVTAPYLEGAGSYFVQMVALRDAAEARRMVAFWADAGATSFKAYMNITRAELGAAIAEAHARGLKVTGHLCSVTYPEAVALGIDDLEHGFEVDTELDPGKVADRCPATAGQPTLLAMTADSAPARALIALLVAHHVAVTSTLPVFERESPDPQALSAKELAVLSEAARSDYFATQTLLLRASPQRRADNTRRWANEIALEKAFVAAGGLLLGGPDPTGAGDVLPGFGDLREIELLVGNGFSPVAAIRVATLNGATYLGLADRIGSIAPGKAADLLVVRGNPAKRIGDIRNTVAVFKDGNGYDPDGLLADVRGHYGRD